MSFRCITRFFIRKFLFANGICTNLYHNYANEILPIIDYHQSPSLQPRLIKIKNFENLSQVWLARRSLIKCRERCGTLGSWAFLSPGNGLQNEEKFLNGEDRFLLHEESTLIIGSLRTEAIFWHWGNSWMKASAKEIYDACNLRLQTWMSFPYPGITNSIAM